MSFIEGQTLADYLHASGPPESETGLAILQDVAAALDAIHRGGVVHRDLKTRNIILRATQNPRRPFQAVVTDFGIAKSLSRHIGDSIATQTGITQHYAKLSRRLERSRARDEP